VNFISSQVAGVELNRGKSASSDQIGLVRFSFSFLLLFAVCNFSRRSYDTYMTLAEPGRFLDSYVTGCGRIRDVGLRGQHTSLASGIP
jgi:hypothetical protein